jgi:hypothetical protein
MVLFKHHQDVTIIHMNKEIAKKVIKLIVEQLKKEKVKGVKIVT